MQEDIYGPKGKSWRIDEMWVRFGLRRKIVGKVRVKFKGLGIKFKRDFPLKFR